MNQQLTHHTSNGCRVNWRYDGIRNDFRTYKRGYGSMLELTWEEKTKLNDGTERKFINDNDTVIMRFCQNGQVRIGFGEVSSNSYPFCQEIIDIKIVYESPICNSKWDFYILNNRGYLSQSPNF
jgi:hypothetical protein